VVVLKDEGNKASYESSAQVACEAAGAIRTVASLTREADCSRIYSESLREPIMRSRRSTFSSSLLFALSQSISYVISFYGPRRGSDLIQLDFSPLPSRFGMGQNWLQPWNSRLLISLSVLWYILSSYDPFYLRDLNGLYTHPVYYVWSYFSWQHIQFCSRHFICQERRIRYHQAPGCRSQDRCRIYRRQTNFRGESSWQDNFRERALPVSH
jgi:ABC transporter transmembrane region